MTLLQFLANKVADEAAEVAQAASKCVEHGEDDFNPKEQRTCIAHMRYEYNDLSSAIALHQATYDWLRANQNSDHLKMAPEADLAPWMEQYIPGATYLHDPKSLRIVWFAFRAKNKGLVKPSALENFWLLAQLWNKEKELTELTHEMNEKFGLTPFH